MTLPVQCVDSDNRYFDRLLEILCPNGRGLVAMMEAYFDESGTHAGSPVMCVAGFLFNPRNARKLQHDMRASLQLVRQKYPQVQFFHMKELAPGGGQFLGVPNNDRAAIERRLVNLINKWKTYGIVVSVSESDFRDVMPAKWIQQYGQAYTTCIRHCVHLMGHWADNHSYFGRIAYFFEKGAVHQAEANGLLAGIGTDPEMTRKVRYGSHTFADKRDVILLQAADVGAWQFNRMEVKTAIKKERPVRRAMVSLGLGRGTSEAFQYQKLDRDNLKGLLERNPIR